MFIKEGKTNWKYILIVVSLAAIVGGGILHYWRQTEKQEFPEIEVPEEEKTEELQEPALKIKDLTMKWKGQLECDEGIEWAKIIDIDNDGKNEIITSCSLTDRLFIFKWKDNNFTLQGDLPKEIWINPWNVYVVNSNDFGSLYTQNKKEFNMIYSPSGGIPWKEGEETIWVRIETFEWNSINKQLQFKTRKSLLGGSAWYIGDINNDDKDELIFFARIKPEELREDYLIQIMSWDGEKFVPVGKTIIYAWMPISYPEGGIQPLPGPQDFMFITDTNNNGMKEIVLLDVVGVREPFQYLYLALEWDGKDFIKFRIDEKMKGKSPQYGVTQYQVKGVGDYDGDGENELITQLLPEKSEEFHLAILKWSKEKNIYEEILGKILPGYNFLEIGDADNDGTKELIFKDKENNLILFSYEEVSEKTIVPGWNIYINKKFGYTINYPEGLFIQIPEDFADNESAYFYVNSKDSILTEGQAYIRIQIGQNPELLGLEDWVYSSYNSELKKAGWCIQELGSTLRLSSSCNYQTWEWKHDLISSEEKVVIISTIGSSKKVNLFEVSEKMLSTFRFLE